MPPDERDLRSTAERLVRAAGLAGPVALDRLPGGRNNRVYRVTLADGTEVVLKNYHADARDDRDRLGSEWTFLAFAWERGVRDVPQPLVRDAKSHAGLYGFVRGRKLSAGEVRASHVSAALDFVCRVNARSNPEAWAPGAEACFSLADHIAAVDRRMAHIGMLDATAPLREDAERFIAEYLIPVWAGVRKRLIRGARERDIAMDARLGPDQTCISPSDFGFHNALLGSDGKLTFLDFEYAGRDDPAKLVCDFFCQPDVPVPPSHYDTFLGGLDEGLGLAEKLSTRCALLMDAYRIKWLCIMLNDFQPIGAARREFAEPGARADRCVRQLQRVARGLELVGTDGA